MTLGVGLKSHSIFVVMTLGVGLKSHSIFVVMTLGVGLKSLTLSYCSHITYWFLYT